MTDGTKTGTQVLKPNPAGPGAGGPFGWLPFNGKGYFAWSDGPDNGTTHGDELWVTNGTTAGTHMLKDLRPGGSSDPQYFTAVGNIFYFGAQGQQHQQLGPMGLERHRRGHDAGEDHQPDRWLGLRHSITAAASRRSTARCSSSPTMAPTAVRSG